MIRAINLSLFYFLGVIIAISIAHSSSAQTLSSKSRVVTTDTRRFSGERYVSGVGIAVFRSTDERSPVIYDIPPNVILYAEPSPQPGWLKVNGIGSRQVRVRRNDGANGHPASSIGLDAAGKLSIVQNADAERYYPINGFIRKSAAHLYEGFNVSLLAATTSSPQPWEDLGISDPRRFVTKHDIHPFDSVARLVIPHGDRVSQCTAFFVGNAVTIVSNRHCFKDENGRDLGANVPFSVEIERSPSDLETLSGTVIADGWTSSPASDWVVIRLNTTPTHSVTPLNIADPKKVFASGRSKAIVVGYPGDLFAASQFSFGFETLSVTVCDLDIAHSGIDDDGSLITNLITCPLGHGFSGSPVLIYNEVNSAYEVIGIDTIGRTEENLLDIFQPNALAKIRADAYNEAIRLRLENADDIANQFIPHGSLKDRGTPSYDALKSAVYDDQDADFHTAFLAPSLLKALNSNLTNIIQIPDLASLGLSLATNLGNVRVMPQLDIGYDSWRGSISSAVRTPSDLIDPRDRAAVYRSPDPLEIPSRRLLGEARALCAFACAPDILDESHQLNSSRKKALALRGAC